MRYRTVKEIVWNGFSGLEFEFDGRPAYLIRPNCKPNGKWALKTEYWNDFPGGQIELLNRGWHVAFNENRTRLAEPDDLETKGNFIRYISETYGLDKKCALIGMSCGGLYAVKTAALYPELVSAAWLDAPVMNFLSWPFFVGRPGGTGKSEEYFKATGRTLTDMLSYRDHPIDKMHILLENNIPVILIAGDSDEIVPYHENGALLEKYYKENGGIIEVHIKPGCGHHPHGLDDPTVIADFFEKYAKQ